eukprot:Nk52_evm6s24 gene=Nk52_evmTU6s24
MSLSSVIQRGGSTSTGRAIVSSGPRGGYWSRLYSGGRVRRTTSSTGGPGDIAVLAGKAVKSPRSVGKVLAASFHKASSLASSSSSSTPHPAPPASPSVVAMAFKYIGASVLMIGSAVTMGVYRSGHDDTFRGQFEKRIPGVGQINTLIHGKSRGEEADEAAGSANKSSKASESWYSRQIAAEKKRIMHDEEPSKLSTFRGFPTADASRATGASDAKIKLPTASAQASASSEGVDQKGSKKDSAASSSGSGSVSDTSESGASEETNNGPKKTEELYLGDPNYGLTEEEVKANERMKQSEKESEAGSSSSSISDKTDATKIVSERKPAPVEKSESTSSSSSGSVASVADPAPKTSAISEEEKNKSPIGAVTEEKNPGLASSQEIKTLKQVAADVEEAVENEIKAELDFSRLNVDKIKTEIMGHNDPIAAAIQRVEILVDQLKRRRTIEAERLHRAIKKQSERDQVEFEDLVKVREEASAIKLEEELSKLRKHFEQLREEEVASLETKNNDEKQKLLEREAKMHDAHLRDELKKLEEKLDVKWEAELRLRLGQERAQRMYVLESLFIRLKAIEAVLSKHQVHDAKLRRGHKLWLASESFQKALLSGKPLADDIRTLRLAGSGHPAIQTSLDSLNESIAVNGLSTLDMLKSRFSIVKTMCMRTALVPDDGGLVSYVFSWVASAVSFEKKGLPQGKDVGSILARAEFYLNKGDLETATGEVNSLKGWPKRLAADWLNEARAHLEAIQALDVINAHVSLNSLRVS